MADNGTEQAIAGTIQSRVKDEAGTGGLDILPLLVRAGELLPSWWSRARDAELSRFWLKSDHVSSAISMFTTKVASVPVKVEPRDASVKRWVKLADEYNRLLIDGSDFGGGWHTMLCPKITQSWLTQDNGFFIEVIGDGEPDGQIRGLPYGLAALDPQNCQRTSNPLYPVIVTDTNGKRYKMHASRILYASSQPSDRWRMNNVGFCPLSRMVQTTQNLTDISNYEQEKLGSRPPRQALIGRRGITAKQIVTAFQMAEKSMDNQGLSRYAKTVVIAPNDARVAQEIDIDIIDLSKAPDQFNKTESITLGMFLIALALNIPPRWIWPATQAGATKADAMFQHVAGMGGGIGYLLGIYQQLIGGSERGYLGGKFLPAGLKLVFDFQDDEQDRARAEIQKLRAENRQVDLVNGVIDVRTAREQAMQAGDIAESQFEDLELKDGRLPNGDSVTTLFMSADPDMQQLLALSVGDVLNIEANAANRDFILERINEKRLQAIAGLANLDKMKVRGKIQQAIAALNELERMYGSGQRESVEPMPESQADTVQVDEPALVDAQKAKRYNRHRLGQKN